MDTRELTAEQEEEALRIADIVAAGTRADALKMGRLLASRKNSALFGATEFEVRNAVQRIGTRALETALVERKKRACGSGCVCPVCREDAAFQGYPSKP